VLVPHGATAIEYPVLRKKVPDDRPLAPINPAREFHTAANNGATAHQPSFGLDTLKMAETYTRTADQERPAEAAMHLLEI
jgi:hypothetical protein